MSGKLKNIRAILSLITHKSAPAIILSLLSLCLVGVSTVRAQDEDAPRRLWDSEFLKKRAESKTPSSGRRTTAYRRATPKKPAAKSPGSTPQNPAAQSQTAEQADGEMIGLTIWRLRPSRAVDNPGARILLEEGPGKEKETEWTPVRVEADTLFALGDRVKLSVESPRDGYLYVIDREQYVDGTFSDPYLIFPSLTNRGGDNAVASGKLVELPEQNAFRLGPLEPNPKYAGELLTIVVTTEPLKEVKPGSGPVKLDPEAVARWESQWAGDFERFELVGGAGKPYTKAEKEAAQDATQTLTQDDAAPQTIYHVNVKRGAPLLVKVPLRVGK